MAKFEIKCGICRKPMKLSGTRDIHLTEQDIFIDPCDCGVDKTILDFAGETAHELRVKLDSTTTEMEMFKKKFNNTRAQLIKVMDNM